jgi:hypothetical protein
MVFSRGCFILTPIKVDVSSRNVLAVCHSNVAFRNIVNAGKMERSFFKTTYVRVYWLSQRRVTYGLRFMEPLISHTRQLYHSFIDILFPADFMSSFDSSLRVTRVSGRFFN